MLVLETWAQSAAKNFKAIGAVPLSLDDQKAEQFDPLDSAGLFIGINEFDDSNMVPLQYAVDDAIDMAYLFAIELKLIDTNNIWLALSGQPVKSTTAQHLQILKSSVPPANWISPTIGAFYKTLNKVPLKTGPGGMLVVQISTHGFSEGSDGYILLRDSDTSDLSSTGVKLGKITNTIRGKDAPTRAPRRLVLIDACRNKAKKPPENSKALGDPNPVNEAFIKNFLDASGQATLCAADVEKYSYEDNTFQQGVFTHFMLEALHGGMEGDQDGLIRLGSLSDWVGNKVLEYTHKMGANHQVVRPIVPADAAKMPLAVDGSKRAQKKALQTRIASARTTLGTVYAKWNKDFSSQHLMEVEKELKERQGEQLEALLSRIERRLQSDPPDIEAFLMWWDKESKGMTIPPAYTESKPAAAPVASSTSAEHPIVNTTSPSQTKDMSNFDVKELSDDDYLTAARSGNLFANLMVCAIYGCQKNWPEWYRWEWNKPWKKCTEAMVSEYADDFQRINTLAQQGSPFHLFLTGRLMEQGVGIKQNQVEAAKYFQKAANLGLPRAQGHLGWCYRHGHGVTKDQQQAEYWLRLGAEGGDAGAQIDLGSIIITNSPESATHWFLMAAQQGFVPGQQIVGWSYLEGIGIEQNDNEALRWLLKAIDAGDPNAQLKLGWMYEMGRGVNKNNVEAVKLYRKSAEKGNSVAMSNLGLMYQYGRGVENDEIEAYAWFSLAVDYGNTTTAKEKYDALTNSLRYQQIQDAKHRKDSLKQTIKSP